MRKARTAIRLFLQRCLIKKERISIWRTLVLNFGFLPFSQAKRLPIFVYGKLIFTSGGGKIILDCPKEEIRRGMIRLNKTTDASGAPGGDMMLSLKKGCIVFKGEVTICRNSKILVWGGGKLIFGEDTTMGYGFNGASSSLVEIGAHTIMGPDVIITDSDCHFTYCAEKMQVRRNNAPTYIGEYCWLGMRSIIMKGVKLPAYTTVAACSLVNKNVTDKERTLVAGQPAKMKSFDLSPVLNFEKECEIANYFAAHPAEDSYPISLPLSQYD